MAQPAPLRGRETRGLVGSSTPCKLDPLARLEKLPDLFPAEALGIPHTHLHPAGPRLPHSSFFHAHLALETAPARFAISCSSCVGQFCPAIPHCAASIER